MKSLTPALLSIPEWIMPWIAVIGLGSWILGAHRLAGIAFVVLMSQLVFMPILAPWLNQLPGWALYMIDGVIILLILQGLVTLVFGKEIAFHVTAEYLIRLLDAVLMGPLRYLGRLFRGTRL